MDGFWLPLREKGVVVRSSGKGEQLIAGDRPAFLPRHPAALCIGSWQGRPLFALEVGSESAIPLPYTIEPFHGADATLDPQISTQAGYAYQLLHWQRLSRFCSFCGTALIPLADSWGKRCPDCSNEHFPHIHPCIIVLVRRGEEFLLVRNAGWPEGRFSLVAGFLELGESLEECVRREVREEAGIDVGNVRYLGSQNWPFPSQQMIGFLADYVSGDLRPDGVEVAEARWFTQDTMPQHQGGIRSISRWILARYA